MNRILSIVLIVLLQACASAPDKSTERASYNGQQHVAMGVLLAIYYCDNKSWPSNIEAIRTFQSTKQIPLPVQVDWAALEKPGVEFNVTEAITFKTPGSSEIEGDIPVSSIHQYPGCDSGNINVNVHINLGA